MNKEQFLSAIAQRLAILPPEDVRESLDYYGEMIDDRVEEGLSEYEAVAAMGSVDEIVSRILESVPLPTVVRARTAPQGKRKPWEIVLLVLGAPLWIPLLISAATVILAVFIVLFAVGVSLWSVVLSFALGGVLCLLSLIPTSLVGLTVPQALLLIGGALVCAGLAILLFFAARWLDRVLLRAGRLVTLGIKKLFVGKGREQ